MKLTKMFRAFATALCCLLALISCRQGPDAASGPLAPVDVIVVTAISYFDEIEEKLSERVDCPVVSLEDIVYEL